MWKGSPAGLSVNLEIASNQAIEVASLYNKLEFIILASFYNNRRCMHG